MNSTIQKVEIFVKDMDLIQPYTIAYQTISNVSNIFILLHSERNVGIGSASPGELVTGENLVETHKLMLERLPDILKGKNVNDWRSIFNQLEFMQTAPAGKFAIETALIDLFCKENGIPASSLFGIAQKPIHTSVTVGIKDIKETIHESLRRISEGFRIIKVKIGLNLDLDIENAIKLDEFLPSDVKIRVDANQGYTVQQLTEYFKKTNKLGRIELIEQPIPKNKPELMSNISPEIIQISAADESLQDLNSAMNLAIHRHFGIFNIKMMKTGSFIDATFIANLAQLYNIDLMWGCNDESEASICAAMILAYSFKNTSYIDLDGSLDLADDFVTEGFKIIHGKMVPSDRPGFGYKIK